MAELAGDAQEASPPSKPPPLGAVAHGVPIPADAEVPSPPHRRTIASRGHAMAGNLHPPLTLSLAGSRGVARRGSPALPAVGSSIDGHLPCPLVRELKLEEAPQSFKMS